MQKFEMPLLVLNDTVLVRMARNFDEYTTESGIYIAGVEHDFLTTEVVMVNEFYSNPETGKPIDTELVVGDKVILEKNFHHLYGMERRDRQGNLVRDRVDHLVEYGQDDEYNYFLITHKDILMKEVPAETPGAMASSPRIMGTFYSTMAPKKVARTGI